MTAIEVKEKVRRVISTHGHQLILKDITEVDNTGSWTRMKNESGKYILVNPANVLAYIIDGEKVF